jgi:hypothetical protein
MSRRHVSAAETSLATRYRIDRSGPGRSLRVGRMSGSTLPRLAQVVKGEKEQSRQLGTECSRLAERDRMFRRQNRAVVTMIGDRRYGEAENLELPGLVMPPHLMVAPDECSEGTRPR